MFVLQQPKSQKGQSKLLRQLLQINGLLLFQWELVKEEAGHDIVVFI